MVSCGKINVPAEIVENGNTKDWEEIKKLIIPPGIIAFIDRNGTIRKVNTSDYSLWVHGEFFLGSIIHTISVNGAEWSVGDWYHHCDNRNHQIESFEWRGTTWKFNTEEGLNTYMYKDIVLGENIFKGKYRKHICQLPDENGKMVDMFEGDITWYVKLDWEISCWKMNNSYNKDNLNRMFSTKEAAEKYVRDNKPVIPLGGKIEEFIYNWETNHVVPTYDLYKYLKSFKDKLDKKLQICL